MLAPSPAGRRGLDGYGGLAPSPAPSEEARNLMSALSEQARKMKKANRGYSGRPSESPLHEGSSVNVQQVHPRLYTIDPAPQTSNP